MAFREWTAIQEAIERGIITNEVSTSAHNVADRTDVWSQLGIYTPRTLDLAVKREAKQPYLVDGLLRTRSLNLLVGDSGLGKTPLAVQIGISVAAGIPVFGKAVQQGPVLYCDAESSRPGFSETLFTISRFLGCNEPPESFYVWSPNWDSDRNDSARSDGYTLIERVRKVQPSFVIVDALRTFWPHAERKNDYAAETFRTMRELKDVTWLVLHHRRKVNHATGVVDLVENPQLWFQEASGALALINQSDTRWGVIPHDGQADLVLGGFMRGSGRMTPLDLARTTDVDGNPIGYTLLTGIEHLSAADKGAFDALPIRFRFKDVRQCMGGRSDSNADRLLKKCMSLEIVRKEGNEYVKTAHVATLERMECVESVQ